MRELPFEPGSERYVSLATFRRNGAEVRTPVWIAGSDARYYVFSEGDAGKVKRVRATHRVRLAACNVRGTVSSEWLDGGGRIVTDPVTIEYAYRALRAKYQKLDVPLDVNLNVDGGSVSQ